MQRACLVAVVVLAGCGGEERTATDPPAKRTARQQIVAAVHNYLNGLADADGPGACRHLTRVAQNDLTSASNAPSCEAAVKALDRLLDDQVRQRLRAAKVTVGQVQEATATAKLAGGDLPVARSIPLKQDAGEWKIAGFEGDVHYRSPQDAQCISGGLDTYDQRRAPKFWYREGRKDFRDYIVEVCRKAEQKGVLDDENDKREVIPIARQVIREMVRRGEIKAP